MNGEIDGHPLGGCRGALVALLLEGLACLAIFGLVVACGVVTRPGDCFERDPKHPGAFFPIDPDDCLVDDHQKDEAQARQEFHDTGRIVVVSTGRLLSPATSSRGIR